VFGKTAISRRTTVTAHNTPGEPGAASQTQTSSLDRLGMWPAVVRLHEREALRREAFFGRVSFDVPDPATQLVRSIEKDTVRALGPDGAIVGDIREEAELSSRLRDEASRCRNLLVVVS